MALPAAPAQLMIEESGGAEDWLVLG